MTTKSARYTAQQIELTLALQEGFVILCLQETWIAPAYPDSHEFDDEDLARIKLIAELREEMGVNDEAIPVILHLLDQVHCLRRQLGMGL